MCRRTTCNICNKPSWKGCGAHVEQVLGDVAPADRCQGHVGAERTSLLKRLTRR